MRDVNQQISSCIESFVYDLRELLRQAAFETVSVALDFGPAQGRASGRARAPAQNGDDSGRGRRSADEIEQTGQRVLEYIQKNPGQSIEQIAQGLAIGSKELSFPVRKLLTSGKLQRTGQKRATRYYAGDADGGVKSVRGEKGRRAARARKA